jgi:hypothetical protein
MLRFEIDGVSYTSDGMHNVAVDRGRGLYALVTRDLRDVFVVSYSPSAGAAVRRATPPEGASLREHVVRDGGHPMAPATASRRSSGSSAGKDQDGPP